MFENSLSRLFVQTFLNRQIMIKKLLLVLLFINTSIATAFTFTVDGITYTTIDGTSADVEVSQSLSIGGYTNSITIPETVVYGLGLTYNVTGIGANAFFQSSITAITLPSSITSIGEKAFSNCTQLTVVTCNIATPLVLNANVFESVNLNSCSLMVPTGGSLSLYQNASVWTDFNSITEIVTILTFTISDITYETTSETTVKVIPSENGYNSNSYTIPETVSYNSNTYNVTGIGASAFANRYGLANITIPSSITSIGEKAFSNNYNLKNVVCNISSPLVLNANVFENVTLSACKLLVSTASLTAYQAADIWKDFSPITDQFPFTVAGITYDPISETTVKVAFNSNDYYSGAITIPDTVTNNSVTYNVVEIDSQSFMDNEGITSITIGSNITVIENYTFNYCSNLSAVSIPSSVTTIEEGAFNGCSSLTSITIPNSVTTIGEYAFSESGLTSFTFPSAVTTIEDGLFSECTNLTAITVPDSITSIGEYAFSETSLTSFIFPSAVTTIEEGLFSDCPELTTITIPSSITSIGEYTFSSCPKLTSLICNIESPLTITENVFSGDTDISSCTLEVPADGIEAYRVADVWEDFGTIKVSTPLHIADFSFKNNVSIYPNPVKDNLFVELGNTEITTIQVIDMKGTVLITRTTASSQNTIDTNNLPTGVYLVTLTSNKGSMTKKLIKN